VSRLRLRLVSPRNLSRSHRIGVAIAVVIVLVGVLGLVFGWGSSSTTRSVNEKPEAFLAQLVQAQQVGDQAFLYPRLDPAVLARYGSAQCQAATATFKDPSLALHLVSVSGPAAYAYESDGHSVSVPNVYTLHVTGTEDNQPVTRDIHLALLDHRFRIFTDCGTPLPGAP
jgi:hypothetical protein